MQHFFFLYFFAAILGCYSFRIRNFTFPLSAFFFALCSAFNVYLYFVLATNNQFPFCSVVVHFYCHFLCRFYCFSERNSFWLWLVCLCCYHIAFSVRNSLFASYRNLKKAMNDAKMFKS